MPTFASKLLIGSVTANAVKTKSLSYHLMLENGLISQPVSKGIYVTLPIGQRIVDKLIKIIENELDRAGCQKLAMPSIAPKYLWEKTNRWNEMGNEMYKLKDRKDLEFCLQPTGEEMITDIVKNLGTPRQSQLPIKLYQTTEKFRDEMNPRFGWLRGKQFIMNDLYTFDKTKTDALNTYKEINKIYERIFYDVLELKNVIYKVEADTGAMGGSLSHEYQIKNNSAEDKLLECKKCGKISQKEFNSGKCTSCDNNKEFKEYDSIEIAHTFYLDQKYSKCFGSVFSNNKNKEYYEMCCFGIGITRLIAACIDALSGGRTSMRMPKAIVPYKKVLILPKKLDKPLLKEQLELVVRELSSKLANHTDIIIDDRTDRSIGKKLVEWNKFGIPDICVISTSAKNLLDNDVIEYYTADINCDKLTQHPNLNLNSWVDIMTND
ncbi:Probable proline--tRNA ligase, mitochondrial [Strongyloides ratti]|uniref:proline--tRNA ligase n=1 Tax=Strongyloides ratti TaxID=34506 RepID=A0A090L0A3_STRRB|nr:Probable proline--tRNA ligase, mitochondrial [Strongyloides ratti]CEF60929.1 Probable proline--tRNA ligase, mitochondrial [Strongyloides ratti]